MTSTYNSKTSHTKVKCGSKGQNKVSYQTLRATLTLEKCLTAWQNLAGFNMYLVQSLCFYSYHHGDEGADRCRGNRALESRSQSLAAVFTNEFICRDRR